jgi:hypothetical protein
VVTGWPSFEYKHRRNSAEGLGNSVFVVQQLPQAKADLLVLAGAEQALDLGNVDGSTTGPSSVEPWPTTPRLPNLDILLTKVSDQRPDRLPMSGRSGIDPVPIHLEHIAAAPIGDAAWLEWPAEDSVAHLTGDEDLAGTAT